ncbi:hairy/enhancer-of-split related with YRPW motif protein 1 [Bicyclus anynana]|uniref:Hairy/enhancer-of-split related with YRPW motif protein 1 n=1 Tax=Bicyclus anynana TaxID=110368 RepID=A0A6J1NHR3_BICAN|nr:hairy/enhancer-of-split related with YRPW motif protein 1 [Bicyclus anynana]XP_052743236.1 hairy/enhancer-of-split related with YRPW motif protein 1 [Bicyclus anynana]
MDPAPLSKTAKYKKITKPLLERKRRARINRCLDELKDLMVGALEIDDDNLSKLEKADILELTVNHLTKLHRPKDPVIEAKKFQAGFGQCAAEACRFIMSVPDLDSKVSQNLVGHLSRLITSEPLTIQVPERPTFSPPVSPSSVVSDRHHYYSDHDRSSSDAEDSVYSDSASKQWSYTRQNKQNAPIAGLLTTVDKLAPHHTEHGPVNGHRNGAYFNKVPAEAKDIILQKIRQHIMDKRGHENISNIDLNAIPEVHPEQRYVREEMYRDDAAYYPQSYPNNNDTLDLRKVRSPAKPTNVTHSPKEQAAYETIKEVEPTVERKLPIPEQCELPMDYNNLPPKKKRKLIEYQEYKKQEEARRQLDAYYAEKRDRLEGPVDHDIEANKWRPW